MWRIYDYGGFPSDENMYLVEGDQKAILFDAGMGKGDLAGYVKTLTNKPIEVAITHGHGDHIGQLDQFKESTVYMSEKDKDKLPKDLNLSKFKWVKEGDVLDLGAGRSFEVLELPTHTPGSLLFLDATDKVLVTSDAVGSGSMVWAFFVPFKELSIYADALKKVEAKIKRFDGLTLFVGHHYQEKVPLTGLNGKQMYTDMRILTEKVIKGEIIGNLVYTSRGTRITEMRQAYYGLAGLWYNPR
jgi:glyoxylase-like metal-dependent hydrolase (beta-lactamase superfamily II)